MSIDNKSMMQKNFENPLLSLRNGLLITICVRIPCSYLCIFMGRIRGQFNKNGWTLEVVEEVKLEPKEDAERPINSLYESSVHGAP